MKTRMLSWTGLGSVVLLTVILCLLANSLTNRAASGQRVSGQSPSFTVPPPEALAASPQPVLRLPEAEGNTVQGTWCYETGPYKVQFEIGDQYIDGSLSLPLEEQVVTNVEFHGEYSVTTDGVLYGVIHSADFDISGFDMDVEGTIEAKLVATRLIEQPFAIRVHAHNHTLTVKDVKLGIGSAVVDEEEELAALTKLFVGRYSHPPTQE